MAFDLTLAARLEALLRLKHGFVQKQMFGGIGWLLHGNMCVGVHKDWLIVRVGEEHGRTLFNEKHIKPMDLTGKVMKGWGMVAPAGITSESRLAELVAIAEAFVRTLPKK